jgi:hypothetical protein
VQGRGRQEQALCEPGAHGDAFTREWR